MRQHQLQLQLQHPRRALKTPAQARRLPPTWRGGGGGAAGCISSCSPRRWLVLPLHTWRSYSFDFERSVTMKVASTTSRATLSGKYVLQMQCNRRYVSLHVLYC
jgi:hypothetical protein